MFEKNTLLRALIATGLTSGLVACGSGDGGGGDGIPSAGSYVTGTFKDASIDGMAYPNSQISASGQNGRACYGQTHYFETADGRVRVYGSTAFSETDFRVVSTMIHSRLDLVMEKFGMSWDGFVDQRPIFNSGHLELMVKEYNRHIGHAGADKAARNWLEWNASTLEEKITFAEDVYIQDTSLGVVLPSPSDWDALTQSEQLVLAEKYYNYIHSYEGAAQWNTLNPDEKQVYVQQTAEHVDLNEQPLINDILLPRDALVACLSPEMAGAQFGEGSQFGIQVPPHVSTYHKRVGEIFTHEIVHFVQTNIADVGQSNPFAVMPRWFTEGQAVYMAGQSLASVDHHHQINAAAITNWTAELDSGENPGFLYQHYGLAYQYVHENNGTTAVVNMMQSMKTNTDAPQIWQRYLKIDDYTNPLRDKDPGLAFGRAFVQYIDDHTGTDLEFERYITDYHSLMNDWAAQR